MMKREEILNRLQVVYNNFYCCAAEKLSYETSLQKDLQLDSLDVLEFAMEVEDNFDVHLRDEEIKAFEKVSDIVNSVERELRKVDVIKKGLA